MGIEPTQDGTSALLTVLKTAEPTRTLPPPATWELTPETQYYTLTVRLGRSIGAVLAEKDFHARQYRLQIAVESKSHFIMC